MNPTQDTITIRKHQRHQPNMSALYKRKCTTYKRIKQDLEAAAQRDNIPTDTYEPEGNIHAKYQTFQDNITKIRHTERIIDILTHWQLGRDLKEEIHNRDPTGDFESEIAKGLKQELKINRRTWDVALRIYTIFGQHHSLIFKLEVTRLSDFMELLKKHETELSVLVLLLA